MNTNNSTVVEHAIPKWVETTDTSTATWAETDEPFANLTYSGAATDIDAETSSTLDPGVTVGLIQDIFISPGKYETREARISLQVGGESALLTAENARQLADVLIREAAKLSDADNTTAVR